MPENNLEPPKGNASDAVHLAARAIISAVPGFGGPALELFNATIIPPLEKRRNEWMQHIAQVLKQLQECKVNVEELKNNEAFIDAVIKASRIAIADTQKEKIEALKNAITHSALPGSPDKSLQQVFFNYVDTFTVFHLRILDLFSQQDKLNSFQQNGIDPDVDAFINFEIPELAHENELTRFVWTDLNTKGLLKGGQLGIVPRGRGYLVIKHTTDFGDKFLSFIRKPT